MEDRMRKSANSIKTFVVAMLLGGFTLPAMAQGPAKDGQRRTTEPVFRVSKRINNEDTVEKVAAAPKASANGTANATPASSAPHPLDRALEIARDGLQHIQEDVVDYTAVMAKRERINNKIGEREFMQIKIRNERTIEGTSVPFSVYMKFLKPRACAGREVIYVKGANDGKLIVHEAKGGGLGFKTFYLDPTGWIAMRENRYPIYDAGIENLVVKLIEKANRDRAAGFCEVDYRDGAISKRPCTVIEVVHPERRQPFDFYKAQVFH